MVWGRATKVSFDHMETLKEKRKISGDTLLTHSLALRPSVFQETESQNPALGISTRWVGWGEGNLCTICMYLESPWCTP